MGVGGGVFFPPGPLGDLARLSEESHGGPSAFFSYDFEVLPAHAAAPAGSQSFHRRFFGSESPRVSFELIFESFAVFSFRAGENTPQERIAAAPYRRLEAVHLGNVHTQTYNHREFLKPGMVSPDANPKPAKKSHRPK